MTHAEALQAIVDVIETPFSSDAKGQNLRLCCDYVTWRYRKDRLANAYGFFAQVPTDSVPVDTKEITE